jgi:hypothetical protein
VRGEAVKTPSDTLAERVHQLVQSGGQRPILSTTGNRAAIESLATRVEILEEALSEVAAIVQELAASQVSSAR